MSYSVIAAGDHEWVERASTTGGPSRFTADLTASADLAQSRARMWRIPPGGRGRRHLEKAQEEVFVVLEGTLTMLIGDPYDRVDVEPHGVVAVKPNTALQLRNESDADVIVFAYGAPPIVGEAEILDDVAEL